MRSNGVRQAGSLVWALLVVLALTLLACGGAQHRADDRDGAGSGLLRVVFVDVGQGDGMVLVTPQRRVIVLDGGPPEAGPAMVDALQAVGATRVDLMLVSHAHADHIGGLRAVLDAFPVLRYAEPAFGHDSEMYAELLEAVVAEGAQAYQLHVGQWIRLDPGIDMTVLSPPTTFLGGTRSDVNSNSLVLLLHYGRVKILFMGDGEAETERGILASGLLEDVDVLKVAHHGSAYSTTQAFLDAARPEIAVISCGAGNSYGHPAPDTVARLQAVATDGVYRTDLDGTIWLETDGETVEVSAGGEPVAGPAAAASP